MGVFRKNRYTIGTFLPFLFFHKFLCPVHQEGESVLRTNELKDNIKLQNRPKNLKNRMQMLFRAN